MPSLTRRVSFTATHRYWRSDWSALRNEQRFGAASTPHAHDYACDATVSGPIDAETGMIIDLGMSLPSANSGTSTVMLVP